MYGWFALQNDELNDLKASLESATQENTRLKAQLFDLRSEVEQAALRGDASGLKCPLYASTHHSEKKIKKKSPWPNLCCMMRWYYSRGGSAQGSDRKFGERFESKRTRERRIPGNGRDPAGGSRASVWTAIANALLQLLFANSPPFLPVFLFVCVYS